jgi:hypothetical protein
MNRRRRGATAALVAVVALAGCDSSDPSATATPGPSSPSPSPTLVPSTSPVPVTTGPSVGPPATAPGDVLDPKEPIAAGELGAAPDALGPFFTTGDEPLPAQTTAALIAAGGQALDVDPALSTFGVFGIPRPSGVSSAVMELEVTASPLGGTDGTSLSTEVLYLVSSSTRIEDLLVDAARIIDPATSGPPSTVADYDGTTGDPRCARVAIATPGTTASSVEGCEYRGDPLTEVRSIGFRRLNLLVTGPPVLPAVFASVPAAMLAAGEVTGYTASFGRPTGPSGNTVQLRVQVHLAAPLTDLGDGWHADGPGPLVDGHGHRHR